MRISEGVSVYQLAANNGSDQVQGTGLKTQEYLLINLEDIVARQATIEQLEQQHKSLEDEFVEALRHSSTDDLVIVDLKRRKLHVKEEIERLRHEAADKRP